MRDSPQASARRQHNRFDILLCGQLAAVARLRQHVHHALADGVVQPRRDFRALEVDPAAVDGKPVAALVPVATQ